jgi:hypothetical protein
MKILLRFVVAILILGVSFWAIEKWYRFFIKGNFYRNADTLNIILMCLIPVSVIAFAYFASKYADKLLAPLLLFLLFAAGLSGCSRAHANMQTLVTSDCGVTWTVIKAGETLPVFNGPCSYSTTIPDYPMQGAMKFRANFKGNVKSNINIGYDYRITDALIFIGEAKYIGKQPASEDAKANDTRFEAAENVVIDKRILDATSELLIAEDIVDFSPLEFENKLLPKINERLKPLGIEVQFLALVPEADELTNDAIDAATAMRIYDLKGMSEVGMEIMKAKAGAAKIGVSAPEAKPKD